MSTPRLAAIAGLAALLAACGKSSLPNPYTAVTAWMTAPAGRTLGSMSMVDVAPNGTLWIAERCGANDCLPNSDVDPILHVASNGQWLGAFGAGLFAWPHGIYVDSGGNIWVTDARGADVVVAPNGDVFVSDGHEAMSNNRIVKFTANGQYIKEWGGTGSEPGKFVVPHALALDSQGRLFVADRDNNRIQIFDQDGDFLDQWTQFGRPSGLHITADDTLYVSDNQSNAERHPGWPRGIYVGSAKDGSVRAFIPDPEFDPAKAQETGAHGLAADADGTIYGAEVYSQSVKKYVR